MALYFQCNSSVRKRFVRRLLLSLLWVVGFAFGGVYSFGSGNSNFFMMRSILLDSVSIVSLIAVSYIPFLFSAFAVSMGLLWLLYPICFLKAFCFGFVSTAVCISFGSAGWLMRLLLMFSDIFSLPLLFLYSLRHISDVSKFSFSEFLIIASVFMLIGSVDYCYVLPLLAML